MKVGVLAGNDEMAYSSIRHFNEQIVEAFCRLGCEAKAYSLTKEKNEMFDLIADRPDFTIGFGSFFGNVNGQPMFDELKIPHIAWVIDHPIQCDISYVQSPYLFYLTIDHEHTDFLQARENRARFVPLGAQVCSSGCGDKKYDLVFTGQIVSTDALYQKWDQYGPSVKSALVEITEFCLRNLHVPVLQVVHKYIDVYGIKVDASTIRFLFTRVNAYVRSYKRRQVIESIRETPIDFFGELTPELAAQPNIRYHGTISYMETLDVFRDAKIAINVSPNYYNGSHDRFVLGCASGAVGLTDWNPYLDQYFTDEENVLFYEWGKIGEIEGKVQAVLKDEEYRLRMMYSFTSVIKEHFTWDRRCAEAFAFMNEIGCYINEG